MLQSVNCKYLDRVSVDSRASGSLKPASELYWVICFEAGSGEDGVLTEYLHDLLIFFF